MTAVHGLGLMVDASSMALNVTTNDLPAVLPTGTIIVVADDSHRTAPLSPEDAVNVAGATPKRCREFAVGRACAREALRRLGFPGVIGRGKDRCPVWPEGVVGSITHCEGFCAAAVGPANRFAGIGIDAERIRELDSSVARIVCTPAELDAHGALNPLLQGTDAALLTFCAKEAFYKAWYPAFRRILRFDEVNVTFGRERDFVAIGPGGIRVDGRLVINGSHVIAGCAPERTVFA
jgi:4'-phosphopantetheinyl transferase EntD